MTELEIQVDYDKLKQLCALSVENGLPYNGLEIALEWAGKAQAYIEYQQTKIKEFESSVHGTLLMDKDKRIAELEGLLRKALPHVGPSKLHTEIAKALGEGE